LRKVLGARVLDHLPMSMKMHSSLARRACAMLCVTMTIV